MIDKFSIVFTRCKNALEEKYGVGKITVESSISDSPAMFPAVSIKQIGSPSTGNSFTSSQCACVSTVEIQTYSIQSSVQAKELLVLCTDTMDKMGYSLVYGLEEITTQSDVKRYIARFRRIIGAGDTI